MSIEPTHSEPTTQLRQRCHRAVALSELDAVETLYANVATGWTWQFLRRPETGLVMSRGRIGGGGAPFNLGEVSVTRASVNLTQSGATGHAIVRGRSEKKAAIAALFDAAAQDVDLAETVERQIVQPLESALKAKHSAEHEKSAATKVEFFTMVRGDD